MPIWKLSVVAWLHKKIVDPLLQILKRGAEPRQLAFSTAVGIALGVFPIFGVLCKCRSGSSVWLHGCTRKSSTHYSRFLKNFCTRIYWYSFGTTIYWYRGAEPRQLAFSTAVGMALGVFPIFGVTVFLCAVAIAIFRERCHAPTIMLTNFVVTPLELSLVIPFLRLGESISGGAHFPLTKDALKLVATGQASSEVLLAVLHALIGWFVASPFMFGTTYFGSLPCFKLLVQKFKPPASPKQSLDLNASDIKIKVRDL